MGRFHVNPKTGNTRECTAEIQCRFGGDESHYSSEANARKAFELSMAGETFAATESASPADTSEELAVVAQVRPAAPSLKDETANSRRSVENFVNGRALMGYDLDIYLAMPAREKMHRKFRPIYDSSIEELDIIARSIDWDSEESVEHFIRSTDEKAKEYKALGEKEDGKKGFYYYALYSSFDFLAHSAPYTLYYRALKSENETGGKIYE